ncbi:NAD(P)/FAD-dependent oxidoreductase [Parasediminibacterium sp. JCM 36343]|uniref:NAD(P)/FAD-dependent oxidoreductase n=1 Tax=Parasediminibacterium sp. JCM 36343 TaxID=3374279 RepID=UPI003978EC9D
MLQQLTLKLKPAEASSNTIIKQCIAEAMGKSEASVTGFHKLKQSIDARSRQQIWVNLTLRVFIDEPFTERNVNHIHFKDVNHATKTVIIVGAGPAGLFAALQLIELGIKPIIVERGKEVRARRRDLALLNKSGIINPESNYCFGEGGAGTYSDGKLYTRSNKRGDINRILNLFVQFGAEEQILYEAHPHIGTNKLPHIITAMREAIIGHGGQFLFEQKVTGFIILNNTIKGVKTHDGTELRADATILATGHSARDIFEMLHAHDILLEAKSFALGVRIEHPQALIDSIQYNCPITTGLSRDEHLPPAAYSLVEQVKGRGVFSFCMCPGGIIAPAATSPNELVVNGWSPSKRNNPYANSGMVVSVGVEDAIKYFGSPLTVDGSRSTVIGNRSTVNENYPLLMLRFQQAIEQQCFQAGGGNFKAPAQRMVDFCNSKVSTNLPECSYHPGLKSIDMGAILPSFIHQTLQEGFKAFGKKMKGYYTNDAVVVATESRTSSPVRIPRDNDTLQHPQIKNLYPCGEGAGYAGGIVSAAMDGERVAVMVAKRFSQF